MTGGTLPTGTVTYLFTDIEGSTRLVQQLGTQAWSAILERHREIIRRALAAHGGVEVQTEGDSFFAVFPLATGAIAAAVQAQAELAAEPWPPDAQVRVRMGLHTGAAELDADGAYVGSDVHRAARIGGAGHGGQVLLSDATRAVAAGDLPAGVVVRDLGEHRLKDLDRPVALHQLVVDGLPAEFPPLRTTGATPTNLPPQLTTFLGREREIAAIVEQLDQARLLTLTGPGGTGKTRLALQVAARVMDRFPDGVWFVALGVISEPDLVAPTIARELGLPDRGGREPVRRLIEHLRGHNVLVVLDNFEQVIDAAPVVAELLAGCSLLVILVTSRSALHVYGEQEFPVPPLAIPDPEHLPDLTTLSQYEAVALFIERARAVRPDFSVTNDNAPAVAEICYRLDGLPLAIELAAARTRILTPKAMLARFSDRLTLLSAGARDLPARQQTLRGAIGWSYDLLDEADRALFARFSVFVGGAELAALEAVCGPSHDGGDVLGTLESLVDKSLVRQSEGESGEPRFTMLYVIREFAAERLAGDPDADEVRQRHAAWFLQLVTDSAPALMGADKRTTLDRLEREHDNIRAAISWATEAGRAEMALRLTAGAWRFWQMRGYLAEGRERVERALALPGAIDDVEGYLEALEAAGGLAYWQGDGDAAQRWYHESLELARRRGLPLVEANALYNLTFAIQYASEGDLSSRALEARAFADEALRVYREIGDRGGEARTLWATSNTFWGARDPRRAAEVAREALVIFREVDDQFMIGWCQYTLALYALQERELDDARQALAEALGIFAKAGDVSGYVLVIDSVASLAYWSGDRQSAARLSGAVAELERRTGTGLNPANREFMGWDPESLRLDPATADAWEGGRQSTPAEAVSLAQEVLARPVPVAASTTGSGRPEAGS